MMMMEDETRILEWVRRKAPDKVPLNKKKRKKLFKETPEDELRQRYVWSLLTPPSISPLRDSTWFYYSIKTTNDRIRLEPVPEKLLKYLHKSFKKTKDYEKYGVRSGDDDGDRGGGGGGGGGEEEENSIPLDAAGGFSFDHRIYNEKEKRRLSKSGEEKDREDSTSAVASLGKHETEEVVVPETVVTDESVPHRKTAAAVGWDVDPENIKEATENDPTFCEPVRLTSIKKSPQKKMTEHFGKIVDDTVGKTWPGNSDLELLAKTVLEYGGNTCLRSEYLINNPLTAIKEGGSSPNDPNDNVGRKKKNGAAPKKRKRTSPSLEETMKTPPILLPAVEGEGDGSTVYLACALDLTDYDSKGNFPHFGIHLYGNLQSAQKKATQLRREFSEAKKEESARAWIERKSVVREETPGEKRPKNDGGIRASKAGG